MKKVMVYLGGTIATLAVAGVFLKTGTYLSANLSTLNKPQYQTTQTTYFDIGGDDSFELVVRTFPDGRQSGRQINPPVTKEDIQRRQQPTSLEEITFEKVYW